MVARESGEEVNGVLSDVCPFLLFENGRGGGEEKRDRDRLCIYVCVCMCVCITAVT